MKSWVSLFLVLISTSGFTSAQVVIQDPNFEVADSCVTYLDQFHVLTHWEKITGEPDYFDCDFTFIIDHPHSDHNDHVGNFVGLKLDDDSLMTADAFGQNLNEVIPYQSYVEVAFIAQGPYGGMYSGACAGMTLYGLSDSIQVDSSYANIGENPNAIVMGTTDHYDFFWWKRDTISFTTTLPISALVFSPEIVPGCKQYIYIDQITISVAPIPDPEPSELQIYPNPVSAELKLVGPTKYFGSDFVIISENGELVKKGKLSQSIDVSSFAQGTYFLRISREDETIEMSFVKL